MKAQGLPRYVRRDPPTHPPTRLLTPPTHLPTRSTRAYTALMKAYMKAKDPDGAEDVLFRLAGAGETPDIHAYTILLRSYSKVSLTTHPPTYTQ